MTPEKSRVRRALSAAWQIPVLVAWLGFALLYAAADWLRMRLLIGNNYDWRDRDGE